MQFCFVHTYAYTLTLGTIKKLSTSSSVHCHDIACCGVAFSEGGGWLCVGDLAGGVWAMQGTSTNSTHKTSVRVLLLHRCVRVYL